MPRFGVPLAIGLTGAWLVTGCGPAAPGADTGGPAGLATGCLEQGGRFIGHDELVFDLAWSPVDDLLVTGGTSFLRLFRVDPDTLQPVLLDTIVRDTRFNSVSWSADGRFLVAPSGPRVLLFPLADDGAGLATPLEGPDLPAELQRAALAPDQRSLLTCDRDGTTTLHRLDLGRGLVEPLASLPVHIRCTRVAWSPGGTLAMSVGLEGLLALYGVDVESGTLELLDTVQADEETGEAIFGATDEDGVAGTFGEANELWRLRLDPAAGRIEVLDRIAGHGSGVSALDFDRDHQRLLSGGHDHTMHLWEVGGDGLQRHYDHPDDGVGVHSARWSRDDRMVARTASNIDQLDILAVHDCTRP